MADINQVITLGIGTPATIPYFIRMGLGQGATAALGYEGDMNTRLLQYLRDYYTAPTGELTTLATRYMNGLTTGDRTDKWRQMVQDATDAM